MWSNSICNNCPILSPKRVPSLLLLPKEDKRPDHLVCGYGGGGHMGSGSDGKMQRTGTGKDGRMVPSGNPNLRSQRETRFSWGGQYTPNRRLFSKDSYYYAPQCRKNVSL